MAVRRHLGDFIARYLGLGGASGDSSNPLSVRGPGSLFDGDSGGHQIRLNKAAVGDTASYVFQTGFSGRAEFGLIGNDDFELKVSPDGSSFTQAFVVDKDTGDVDFKQIATINGNALYDVGDFNIADYALLTGATFSGDVEVSLSGSPTVSVKTTASSGQTSALDVMGARTAASNSVSEITLTNNLSGGIETNLAIKSYQDDRVTYDTATHQFMSSGSIKAEVNPFGLGVGGASADATNGFAFYGTNLLLNTGGSIDLKYNKNASGNDASMTFQTGFSTKALMGLLGDDDFTIKVGSSFTTAVQIDESTGRVNMPETPTQLLQNSGRVYCYFADNRWITDSDDNYGTTYYQWSESGGTGTNPTIEWEHRGRFLPKGTRVHRAHIIGRANNLELTDMEIYIFARHPNPITRWETGLDNDSEDTVVDIHRDLYMNPTGGGAAFTGNFNDMHKRTIETDFVMPEDGYLSIFFKPVGTMTANCYFLSTLVFEIGMS